MDWLSHTFTMYSFEHPTSISTHILLCVSGLMCLSFLLPDFTYPALVWSSSFFSLSFILGSLSTTRFRYIVSRCLRKRRIRLREIINSFEFNFEVPLWQWVRGMTICDALTLMVTIPYKFRCSGEYMTNTPIQSY